MLRTSIICLIINVYVHIHSIKALIALQCVCVFFSAHNRAFTADSIYSLPRMFSQVSTGRTSSVLGFPPASLAVSTAAGVSSKACLNVSYRNRLSSFLICCRQRFFHLLRSGTAVCQTEGGYIERRRFPLLLFYSCCQQQS